MTCIECVHFGVCGEKDSFDWSYDCKNFIDKSRFIELPCKLGEEVYEIIPKCDPAFGVCPFSGGYGIDRCGKDESGKYRQKCNAYIKKVKFTLCLRERMGESVFFTREEAEKALKECEK